MTPWRDHALRVAVWLVIASEALLFAGLFALYGGYVSEYPREFHAAAARNLGAIGGANTMILLASSFCVAFAIHRVRAGKRGGRWLGLVMALGIAFLALKSIEWTVHLRDGIAPGASGDLPARGAALFFTLYYAMTGLHAAHVVAGLALVGWCMRLVRRGRITDERPLVLELVGVYWHFVDIVWVFLWPLFYLVP